MRSRWLFIPPPMLFVAPFVAGLAFGHVVPLGLPASARTFALPAGITLLALGAALGLSSVALFIQRRTTIVPHSTRASTLVATGPFRLTRNPMYLGLSLSYLGGALIANVAWPLLLVALPLWVMNARVIPHEEATLTGIFGDDYRTYQQHVRRWL